MTVNRKSTFLSEEDQKVLGELDEENISPKVHQYAARAAHMGPMENPDGQAMLTGFCEDTVLFQLRVNRDVIGDVRFQTNGCGFTIACASVAAEMVRRKGLRHALGITGKQIDKALDGLPKKHVHCADLAANTLRAAAKNVLENIKEPWKRMYVL